MRSPPSGSEAKVEGAGGPIGATALLILMGLSLLATIVGLPGTIVILLLAFVYAWATGFGILTWQTLLILAGITLVAETVDQIFQVWGARRGGASLKGLVGSVVGGIAGALLLNALFPLVGGVLGAFLGAYAGALLVERSVQGDWERAHRAAWGGFLGRAAGIGIKLLLAAGMIGLVAWRIYG
jgi:uncharacterized protein YqgC (DUF456 family)